jgi:putative endonuclease
MSDWFVYMVRCSDKSLYTGISTDVKRRVNEHNNAKQAASYTRSRRPVTLVYQEKCEDRSDASKREYELKNLKKSEKEGMLKNRI